MVLKLLTDIESLSPFIIFNGTSTAIPGIPITLNPNSTVEFGGTSQNFQSLTTGSVTGLPTNIIFSGSGTKTGGSISTLSPGLITIKNAVIVDATGGASFGVTGTALTMEANSKLSIAGSGTQPNMGGVYTLDFTSTIEFAGTSGSDVRLSPTYAQVIVAGTNISNTSTTTGLKFQSGGSFTVKNGAIFKISNISGFSNVAGNSKTSLSNLSPSNPTITLEPNSTIDYAGASQTITTAAITSPTTGNYYNLSISGSGVKTAPATDLTILGNLSRTGTHTYNAGAGRVVFAGTIMQTYSATTGTLPINFYNFSNTNSVGLKLDSTIGIQNELNLSASAKLNLNIGDINMRSTAIRTAYITDLGTALPSQNITYGATGLFNIERYLASVKSWRLLATPIQSSTFSITNAWREGGTSLTSTGYGTQITGPATSSGMDTVTLRGSMKWYNKASNNYVEITNTADAIARPQGYYVFVRGDRAQSTSGTGSATNLRMKGKILTGDQTFSTLTATGPNNGFESVGNPYPSQINYKKVTKSNLESSFTVWNPTAGVYGAGRFIQYVSPTLNGDYSNGGVTVNSIESGQAFFIQSAVGVNGSITIKEYDKLAGSNLVSRNEIQGRPGATIPTLEINLHEAVSNSTQTYLDHVVLNFDNNYSNGFDRNDVRKFMNANDNLALKNGERSLILEKRSILSTSDTIFLSLTNTRIAQYGFEIDPSLLGNLPLKGYLKDKFLKTETEVSFTDVTNIHFSITSDAASKEADRFIIVFKRAIAAGQLPGNFITIAAEKNSDQTNTIKWSYSNEYNVGQYSIERSTNGTAFTGIGNKNAANLNTTHSYTFTDAFSSTETIYYRVKATSTTGQVHYSDIVKVVENDPKSYFTVQPNPVVNKTLHINFGKLMGNFTVKLIAKQGATVFSKQINVSSVEEVKHIVLGTTVTAGVYELVLVDGTGKKLLQTVYIK